MNLRRPGRDQYVDGPEYGLGRTGWIVMIKLVTAISAAALLAGVAVMIPGMTPSVEAHMYGVKGDRLDNHSYGPTCSQRGWPYFETSCLRNLTTATRDAHEVRVVSIDRTSAVTR
jgi:hypothetical protein